MGVVCYTLQSMPTKYIKTRRSFKPEYTRGINLDMLRERLQQTASKFKEETI